MLLTLNILPSSRKSLIILSIVHRDQLYFIALVAIIKIYILTRNLKFSDNVDI